MLLTVRTALASILLLAAGTGGGAAEVKDRAALFSPSARREAEQQLRDLERTFGKRVIVETSKPGAKEWLGHLIQRPRLRDLDPAAQRRALDEEAQKRAAALGPHGVLVFLYHDPPLSYVQIETSDADLKKALPASARQELQERVLAKLTANQSDAALAELVTGLRSRFSDGLTVLYTPPPAFNWAPVAWSIAGLLALWLVVELAQVLSGGRPGGGSAAVSASAFGGGAFLSGLFAAMARCGSLRAAVQSECAPLPTGPVDESGADAPAPAPAAPEHAHEQS
jgi:hypothetical protein